MKLAVFVSLMVALPFQAEAGSCVGKTVEVWVVNAMDLTGDVMSQPDPYVLVQIGDRTQRTRVIHDNANPTWWRKFKFYNSNSDMMKIDVWEKDGESRRDDDHLGSCMEPMIASRSFQRIQCIVKDNGVVKVIYKCY